MLKYTSFDVVFQEIPDEVTLAINLTNCPNRCVGCHSPHLRGDIGDSLTEERMTVFLGDYAQLITCVCFMGGDANPDEVAKMAQFVKRQTKGKIKTAWYSGKNDFPENFDIKSFDFVKIGPYDAKAGDLRSVTTNQRLYRFENGEKKDMTFLFRKR